MRTNNGDTMMPVTMDTRNTIPFPGVSTNASQSYLNGYYAFTNYNANIVYLLATYRFATR